MRKLRLREGKSCQKWHLQVMAEPHCAAGWSPRFANAGAHVALTWSCDTHTHILAKLCRHSRITTTESCMSTSSDCVATCPHVPLSPQAVLSDDGVGTWLGEPDPPEEPLTLQASVPPHQLRLGKLHPHTPYHIRVACVSSQGPSPWTHWLPVETPEGGKKGLVARRRRSLPH